MNRNSRLYRFLHRVGPAIGRANIGYILNISGVRPQTDYNAEDPRKEAVRPLDSSPEAVRKREKAARNALIVPLAIVLGAILFFVAVCLAYR